MKNRQVQDLLNRTKKKALTLFLGVTTALSMTACSLDFEGSDELMQGLMDITFDYMYDLADNIGKADLSTEEGVSEVRDQVFDLADEAESKTNAQFVKATLVRVVDGDTLVVNISGEDKKVRLIGINTPESVAPSSYRVENSAEGVAASEYVKDLLSDVTTVYLQKDKSDTDRYGRLLRYVWLETPNNPRDINEVAEKMLNGILVLDKIAEPAKYAPDTSYADTFDELYQME